MALALPVIAGVDGDWTTTGNSGTTPGANFVGTTDNKALELKVNNARVLRLAPNPTSPNIIGGYSGNTLGGGIYGATIGGGGYSATVNSVLGIYGLVGGGAGNVAGNLEATVAGGYKNTAGGSRAAIGGGLFNNASGTGATVAGGRNNVASGDYSVVAGGGPWDLANPTTTCNKAIDNYCVVSGGTRNQAGSDDSDPTDAPYATVGGGWRNRASDWGATVGGGDNNQATCAWATVGGGCSNVATVGYATVGGGNNNQAAGYCSIVGGGDSNQASGECSIVGGGDSNQASSTDATVGGGYKNFATGAHATVPGGAWNTAYGDYSFAAGWNAYAAANGAFAWADSTSALFINDTADRFAARASGGVYFYTNGALTTGAYLAAGSGTWADVSDREVKQDFAAVDGAEVLEKVSNLPITTWSYRTEDQTVRHMGPMAQDMHAAFGLGDSDKSITTIDGNGVALAAIQGLNKKVQDQNAEIQSLRNEIETLKALVREMAQK